MQRFFKTLSRAMYEEGKVLDTSVYNYLCSVKPISDNDANVFDEIYEVSRRTGTSLEQLVINAINRKRLDERDGERLSAQFRERLYERIRVAVAPEAPARLGCLFACPDLESINRYRAKHQNGKINCELKVVDLTACFQADMEVLDEFNGDEPFAIAEAIVTRYWRQERTRRPLLELLVQGKFVVGPEI